MTTVDPITLVEIDGNVQGTSSTSNDITLGTKSFTLDRSEPFFKGQSVEVRNNNGDIQQATVLNLVDLTLVVEFTSISGSGTYSDWVIDGERTIYLGTSTYVSKRTDTPALTDYIGALKNAGDIKQYMYNFGRTFGNSRASRGDIIINNEDGQFDFIRKMGFKRGSLRIKQVKDNLSELPTETIFAGTVVFPEVSFNKVIFRISDRLGDLDRPAQEALFDGSNAGPTGIEGTEDDIKGDVKPFSLGGEILNVRATLVNSSTLIYGLNFDYDGNTAAISSVAGVYDEGLALNFNADYADLVALQAATVGPGNYATCLAEGLIRLHATPNGVVTVDYTEATRTGADIVKNLIERLGFTSGDYLNQSFIDVDAANSDPQEVYIDNKATVLEIANEIMAGMGGYIISNVDNQIEVGLLLDPATQTSLATFDKWTTIDLKTLESRDPGKGIPPKQVNLSYRENYYPMSDSEFAGATTDARRLFLRERYRVSEGLVNENVDRKHANAPIFDIVSKFVDVNDAASERARQELLRQEERNFYTFRTSETTPLDLGDVITIQNDERFDLTDGLKVVIMGKEINFARSTVTYTVWG